MGNSFSQSARAENIAKQVLTEMTQVCQESISNMGSNIQVSNTFIIDNCNDSKFNNINQYVWINIDQTSKQYSQAISTLSQSLENEARSKAEAISSGLGLNNTDSKNVYDACVNLSTTIHQIFTQNCISNLIAANRFEAKNCSRLEVGSINQTIVMQQAMTCIMQNKSVSSSTQNLKNTIDQSASAKSVGLSTGDFLLIFAIVAAVAVFVVGIIVYFLSKRIGLVLMLIGLVLMALGGASITMYGFNVWPYSVANETDSKGQPVSKNFGIIALLVSIGTALLGLVLSIVGGYVLFKK